ncbi:MAG TPA: hypothetical protein VF594_03205 [Rubricoccaceae bacterium]|jgi:hypothetical protein
MRLALFLLAAPVLAGCASTTLTVDVSDATAVRRAEAAVVGRQADITLASGDQYRGRVVFLRPDSTAWTASERAVAVPTTDVASVAVGDGPREVVRRTLIGTGKVAGACALFGAGLSASWDGDASDMLQAGLIVGAVCVPPGFAYGLLGAAVTMRQTVYVFAPPLTESGPRPPAGTPEDGDAQ